MAVLLDRYSDAASQTFDCGHNDGCGIAVNRQLHCSAGIVSTGTLERSRRLSRQQRTDQGKQSIRQRARFANLSRGPVRKGAQLLRRAVTGRSAAHDLHIYRNTVQSVPDLVTGPPDYLTNRLRTFRPFGTGFSHSGPHHRVLPPPPRGRGVAAACAARPASRTDRPFPAC
jgi:hypothetical protein